MCQDNNHWSSIVLAIIWVISHLMLFISTMCPRFVAKYVRAAPLFWCISSTRIPGYVPIIYSTVHRQYRVQVRAVRVPYQTLIEEYADKFFSPPVPCTIGEKIDKLKLRPR